MRSTLLGLLLALAACGGSSAKRSGESCFASSDCEDGLVCDMGREPNVCAPTSTMVDAAEPDAGDDAAGPDSGMPADAGPDGPRPDGPPPIDGAIDAAIDAAPPVDAAEPDAAVDADIDAM